MPGDPNGAFYADGRYHLMYLYRNTAANAFHWGHISSADLLHWIHHPDALTGLDGDEGCFSGGAFVDDDGTAYLSFWQFPSRDRTCPGGLALASSRPPYDVWERMESLAVASDPDVWGCATAETEDGPDHRGCADPSNIWKAGGKYYMQAGNLCVLNAYGRASADSPYAGDWVTLYRSDDLKSWTYAGRFYSNPRSDPSWPDSGEDCMCPAFCPLPGARDDAGFTDKWIEIFIAHNRGAQYYVGDYRPEEEKFFPEVHGRFSWRDSAVFAPETLIDGENRLIVWYWLASNFNMAWEKYGWSGMYTFPRQLWWEDGKLHMAPVRKLDGAAAIEAGDGRSFRVKAKIDMRGAKRFGLRVRIDPKTGECSEIMLDAERGVLEVRGAVSREAAERIDLLYSQKGLPHLQTAVRDGYMKEEAPLVPGKTEGIYELDVFADQSILEVYVNGTQAVGRETYPTDPAAATGIEMFSDGAQILSMKTFVMMRINPY